MQPPTPPPPVAEMATNTEVMVWSASATTAAVLVALGVAVWNALQRGADQRRDRDREMDRARAQARLVRVLPIEQFPRIGEQVASNELLARAIPPSVGFSLAIINHSDRAILAVNAQVWSDDAVPTDEATGSSRVEVIAAGGHDCVLGVKLRDDRGEPLATINAWRVRWTDADGRRWCYDQYPQDAPAEYTGQPPRPCS